MADWLHQRRAIVTGAARGVGLAVAQSLGLLGAKVLLVDNGCAIDGAAEDPVVTELAAARVPGAESINIDVGAPGSGAAIVEAAMRLLGGIDLIVHAAGVQPPRDGRLAPREAFEHVARVDLLGAIELFEAAIPQMQLGIASGRLPGAIVSLAAPEAVYGDPERAVEAASKAALIAWSRSTAHRLASTGIGVNVVLPMAGTRQVDSSLAFSAEREAHHRLIRPLAPSLVANLVAWLCTPLAAGINGQVFMARGREIILFSQGRPENSFFQSQLLEPDELAQSMKAMRRDLTDDWTVLDAFGNDPVP